MNDHFSLFGLPARFALDEAALAAAYQRVQSQVHPDRFAAATPAERRVAMQWATRANEAYGVLRAPLKRAAYLCELRGVSIDAESNTRMPIEFMQQQMQWREALDAATRPLDPLAVTALAGELARARTALTATVANALDARDDAVAAAAAVRQWLFVERFAEDVRRAQHAIEDAPAGAAATR